MNRSKQSVFEALYLKAARYSASPIGGSSPPVNAMLTLNPSPSPLPTCSEEVLQESENKTPSHNPLTHTVALPLQERRCPGRSSHRRIDEAKRTELWDRRRTLVEFRCHDERPESGLTMMIKR